MKKFCFRIITMATVFYFTGTMAAPSRKSSTLLNSECKWNGYHLLNCSFAGKYYIPMDMSQTKATVDIGFFRILLQPLVNKEEWNIRHLDLSNTLIWKITLPPLVHLHALEILNLSNNAIQSISLDPPSSMSERQHHRSKLSNGLSSLKFLILQKNKLTSIPKGLWKLKSLQNLDLSLNGLSQIGLFDFYDCLQLRNLNLKSNRIFRIHPKAFMNLKKLQAVDLSDNALSTILPMMSLALQLPRLEVNLTDNQWHCDSSVSAFQNVISQPWRRKWNIICNRSIENKAAYWWTSPGRIAKGTHLPHTNSSHISSLRRLQDRSPQEELHVPIPTLGKKEPASSNAREKQKQLTRIRRAKEGHTPEENEKASQDLTLAICLSVFITFFVAFCLGAFARPYIDRLLQQRCRTEKPSPGNAYANEGFYDEVEGAWDTQQQLPKTDLHQSVHNLKLHEKQNPSRGIQSNPDAVNSPDKDPRTSRKEADSWQRRQQHGANTGARSRRQNTYANGSVTHSSLQQQSTAGSQGLTSEAQVHSYRQDTSEEPLYDAVAGESSLNLAGRLQTASDFNCNNPSELDPPLSREMVASLPKRLMYTNAQRPSEKGAERCTDWLSSELPRDLQRSTYANLVSRREQQHGPKSASGEEEPSSLYSEVTPCDLADTGPSSLVCPPAWDSDPHFTSTDKASEEKHSLDTQCELDTSYDSDEGSLFTLSSTSSEGARNMIGEEACGEELDRASESSQEESLGVMMHSVMTLEKHEGGTSSQKILRKSENQEDPSEKSLTSSPDSDLCETPVQSASNTHACETPLSFPGSQDSRPCSDSDESSGMFTHGSVTDLHSEPPESVEWHHSLKSLLSPDVSISSQTQPPRSTDSPSDSDKSTCGERDSDIGTCEPSIQGQDTAQNDNLLKVTKWENLRPSRDSEGGNENSNPKGEDEDEGLVYVLDSRTGRRAQLLRPYGDETCSSV